jgi:hypothetical protein
MDIVVFWVVTPYSLVDCYFVLDEHTVFNSGQKTEAAHSFETSLTICHTTRHNIKTRTNFISLNVLKRSARLMHSFDISRTLLGLTSQSRAGLFLGRSLLLCKPKVYYRVQKSLPLDSILSYTNSVHIVNSVSLRSILILSFHLRLGLKWPLSLHIFLLKFNVLSFSGFNMLLIYIYWFCLLVSFYDV